jgi:hypothetical protein
MDTFSTFSVPIFVIPIIGFTHFLSRIFEHVELKGKRFRNVPYVLVFAVFFYLEGYLALAIVAAGHGGTMELAGFPVVSGVLLLVRECRYL